MIFFLIIFLMIIIITVTSLSGTFSFINLSKASSFLNRYTSDTIDIFDYTNFLINCQPIFSKFKFKFQSTCQFLNPFLLINVIHHVCRFLNFVRDDNKPLLFYHMSNKLICSYFSGKSFIYLKHSSGVDIIPFFLQIP